MNVAALSPTWAVRTTDAGAGALCLAGTRVQESAGGAGEHAAPSPRATMRRAREWRAGRLAAAAALELCAPSASLAVREAGPRRGQPYGRLANSSFGCALSLSHSDGHVIAAAGDRAVGVDLEQVVAHSDAFVDFAFSADERARFDMVARMLGVAAHDTPTLQWCAKEAALKLLGCGLRAPLHSVEVLFGSHAPRSLVLHGSDRVVELQQVTVQLRCAYDVVAELDVASHRMLPLAFGRADSHLFAVIWE